MSSSSRSRALPASAHIFPSVCVALAVAAFVYDSADAAKIVLTVGIGLASAGIVLLIASRTTRARFLVIMVGWIGSGFVAALLAATPTIEFFTAPLIFMAALLWGSRFVPIRPERP